MEKKKLEVRIYFCFLEKHENLAIAAPERIFERGGKKLDAWNCWFNKRTYYFLYKKKF